MEQAHESPPGAINPNESQMFAKMQEMFNEIQFLKTEVEKAKCSQNSNMIMTQPNGRLFNKPKPFTGKVTESIESFIGHVELYLYQAPEHLKLSIAVSFLEEDAFLWYSAMTSSDQIATWEQLKALLLQRYKPLNKTKLARDKLANCSQYSTVSCYNEDFIRIITDIPTISAEEAVDRYMRGLKKYIRTELCTKEYSKVNDMMSDALKVESSKGPYVPNQFSNSNTGNAISKSSEAVPMDVSNVQTEKNKQREEDRRNNRCFYCHQSNCRIATCPQRKESDKNRRSTVSNIEVMNSGNESPPQQD